MTGYCPGINYPDINWFAAPNSHRFYDQSWTFDASGNVNGTAIIRETVPVAAATGDTFKGTFSVDYYDLAGNHLTGQSISGQ